MRAVTLAAKSPLYTYYLSTRIVAADVRAAIAHARACNEMWWDAFVIVSDDPADEPATDPGTWPRTPRFDMDGLVNAVKAGGAKLRVVAAMKREKAA